MDMSRESALEKYKNYCEWAIRSSYTPVAFDAYMLLRDYKIYPDEIASSLSEVDAKILEVIKERDAYRSALQDIVADYKFVTSPGVFGFGDRSQVYAQTAQNVLAEWKE